MSDWISQLVKKFSITWEQIWFQDKNTIPLEVVRMGVGLLLFINYAMLSPSDVLTLYGDAGLFSYSVVPEMTTVSWFSFYVFLEQDWQVLTFHYVFVVTCFLLFIGWKTS